MDVAQNPRLKRTRRRRRAALLVIVIAVLGGATLVLGRLGPSEPVVDRSRLWIDTVKQGPLVLEVRGAGNLVADEFIWLAAETDGQVQRKTLRAGAEVRPDSEILMLKNRETEQAALSADLALQAARAAYVTLEATLKNELRARRAAAAAVEAEQTQAQLQADVDSTLARDGLLAEVVSKQSAVRAASLKTRLMLEQEQVDTGLESIRTRLAQQQAEVDISRATADLRRRDVEALRVLATINGVLQEVVVDEGQRVARGANLARVADPSRLKAELRVPETQTRDIRVGLPARIDTHNGVIEGEVSRIDPAAQNGTVTVDVALRGGLPKGARLDMTVDGVIQLERVASAIYVGRPAVGQAEGTLNLFRLSADGVSATRTVVRVGRVSTNAVEILGGLSPGDQVILSDSAAWEGRDVIRIK
jgi:HlyD family secretion protein